MLKCYAALAALSVLAGCDTAQLTAFGQAAQADFSDGCADWGDVASLAGAGGALLPPPFDALAAATIAVVGDACSNPSFAQAAGTEQVVWIRQASANLKSILAQADAALVPTAAAGAGARP
jgi:hypothetical protein